MRLKHGLALLAISLGLHTATAWPLGLGDARVESFIGQPLEMRIALLTAPGDYLESVSARLASAEDFALIGASQSSISVPLRFTVLEGDDGSGATILVTSRLPLNDPVLRLVVEVNWSSGRLLREYTVFLDPPTVPARAPAPVTSARDERPAPPEQTPAPEPDDTADTAEAATQAPAPAEPRESPQPSPEIVESPSGANEMPSGGSYGPVRSGETLWRVASSYMGQAAMDRNQVMLAIQRKNPQAFVDENINLLMRGATLEMPTPEEVESVSRQRARELVAQQEAAFRMRSSLASASTPLLAAESTPDVPERDAVADEQPGEEAPSQARLEIVPASDEELAAEPGTGAVPGGEGSDEVQGDLREELARTEEELISERQQNEYLRERISELEAQIAQGEEPSEGSVADDDLANLEDRLQRERLQAEEAAGDESGESSAPDTARPDVPSVTTTGGEDDRPWYSGPMTWIIMIVIVVAAIAGWIFNRRRGDEYDLEAGSTSEVSDLTGEAEDILRTLDSDHAGPEDSEESGVVEVRVPEAGEGAAEYGRDYPGEDEPEDADVESEHPADDDEAEDDADADRHIVPPARARRSQADDDDAKVLDESSSDPEIKLDLARAYISMGDKEAARVILEEVLNTGNDQQQSEARTMMDEL